MQPVEEHKEIPLTQIAVNVDFMPIEEGDEDGSRRRLALELDQPIWFKDQEQNRLIRVALLDALQVQMKMDKDSDVDSKVEKFAWDIKGYSEDYIWL